MTAPEILLLIGSVEDARPVIEGGVSYSAQSFRPAVPGNFPIPRLVMSPSRRHRAIALPPQEALDYCD